MSTRAKKPIPGRGRPASAFAVSRADIEWPSLPERRLNPANADMATPDFQAEVSRILLNSYTPAGVLVDDSLDILQTHGSTRRFLELPSGVVSTNLAKMAHASLSLAIRAAVRRAKTENVPVKRRLRASLRDGEVELQLDVVPVKTPLERRRRYLVLFAPLSPLPGSPRAEKSQARQLEFQHERRPAPGEAGSDAAECQGLNEELESAAQELTTANDDLARCNAELRAANSELHELVASARIPVLVLDKDLRVRRFTPAAETSFDLRSSDLGKRAATLRLADALPDLEEQAARALHGRPVAPRELRDRQGRWYDLWIRPHLNRDKAVDGLSLVFLETTPYRKERLELRSSRDYADAALGAARVAWVVVDSALRVVAANEHFYVSFKTSAPRAAGRALSKLGKRIWSDRTLQDRLHELTRDERTFADFESEFELPAHGTRTLRFSGGVVQRAAEDRKEFLITIEDVTQRKQAAETAALRKSEGRQRDFVANVSHELMTPITAIKGYSEALVAGALEVPGKRLKFTQIIEKHADRLTQLVEDLLQLSTSEAGHKKSVDTVPLAAQLKRLLLGLSPVAQKKGVSIRVKVAPELKVAVNKAELNQILQNLVSNAIKYNRPKGRVVIAASVVGKRIIVSVQDTGIGVPKEDLTRIFDRFHRAANARSTTERGTGLGLSIVKSILVAHGCRIWAESSSGRGTTFFFTLPKG